MLLVIYIFLIILCYLRPESKKIFYFMLAYLWFLSAFCIEKPDIEVYEVRYMQYDSLSSMTEVGYTLLMYIFNKLHISFEMFLKFSYAFILGVVGWFISNNTKKINIVLAMYAIAPYCSDMVQLRSSYAFAFILIGLNILLNQGKRGVVKYILFTAIASTFHYSAILFLVVLIPIYCSFRKTCVITAITTGILFIFNQVNLLERIITLFVGNTRAVSILSRINSYGSDAIYNIILAVIASVAILIVMLMISKKNILLITDYDEEKKYYLEKIKFYTSICVVSIITVSLVPYALDVYRIARYLMIISYIGISYYDILPNKHIYINKGAHKILCLLCSLCILYIQVYKLNDFEDTFWTLFVNNQLL